MGNKEGKKSISGEKTVRIVRHWSYRGYDADVQKNIVDGKKGYMGSVYLPPLDVSPFGGEDGPAVFQGRTLREAKKDFKYLIDCQCAYLEDMPIHYAVCIKIHGVTCYLCKQWKIPLTPNGHGNYGTFDEDRSRAILFASREAAQNETLRYDDSFVEEF